MGHLEALRGGAERLKGCCSKMGPILIELGAADYIRSNADCRVALDLALSIFLAEPGSMSANF